MRVLRSIRLLLRSEPRFWLPVGFLVTAAGLLALIIVVRNDEGALLGWLGVFSAFLTAGMVDLFGLLEGRRRRLAEEQRLAPVRVVIARDLHWQRRDLLTTVSTLFPVTGEPSEWEQQLRGNDWAIVPGDLASVYPPQNKATYLTGLRSQMLARQEHLEALAAGGILTTEVSAMSELVLRGVWQAVVAALYAQVGTASTGASPLAADMIRDLLGIEIPNSVASAPNA